MVTQELQKKLKEQDLSAYNYIYEKYGWELHNYLQNKCPDREAAADIFCRVMHQFCTDLSQRSGTDVLEMALLMYADQALRDMQKYSVTQEPAGAELLPTTPAEEKKRIGIGQILLLTVLLILAGAAFFVIAAPWLF